MNDTPLPPAGQWRTLLDAIVKAWVSLGTCEDEFMPEFPDACVEWRDALDSAIAKAHKALTKEDQP